MAKHLPPFKLLKGLLLAVCLSIIAALPVAAALPSAPATENIKVLQPSIVIPTATQLYLSSLIRNNVVEGISGSNTDYEIASSVTDNVEISNDWGFVIIYKPLTTTLTYTHKELPEVKFSIDVTVEKSPADYIGHNNSWESVGIVYEGRSKTITIPDGYMPLSEFTVSKSLYSGYLDTDFNFAVEGNQITIEGVAEGLIGLKFIHKFGASTGMVVVVKKPSEEDIKVVQPSIVIPTGVSFSLYSLTRNNVVAGVIDSNGWVDITKDYNVESSVISNEVYYNSGYVSITSPLTTTLTYTHKEFPEVKFSIEVTAQNSAVDFLRSNLGTVYVGEAKTLTIPKGYISLSEFTLEKMTWSDYPDADFELEVNGNEITITGVSKGKVMAVFKHKYGNIGFVITVEHNVEHNFTYTYEGQTITYTVIDEEAKTCRTKSGYYDSELDSYIPGNNVSGTLILPANPKDGETKYTLDDLGIYAFANCSELESVIIPDGVTEIGDYAFQKCSRLSSINIPDGVTSIGDFAFLSCSKLTSITIPKAVTSISNNAFIGCIELTSVFFEGTTNPVADPTSTYAGSNPELKVYVPGEAIAEYANFESVGKVYATITSLGLDSNEVTVNTRDGGEVTIVVAPAENTDPDYTVEYSAEGFVSATVEDGKLILNGLKEGSVELTLTSAQPGVEPVKMTVIIDDTSIYDLDGDGGVDVTDVVSLVSKMIKHKSDPEIHDFSGDGKVDVSDIVMMVGRALRASIIKPGRSRSADAAEVPVSFAMSGDYTAMQTDIVVADGARIEDVTLNAALARTHTLAYSELAPDRYRVIVYSLTNRIMDAGADEPLFSLAMTGDTRIETEATIFVEAQPVPTSIDAVGDDAAVESVTYFDLQGRQVSPEATGILIERTVLTDSRILTRKIRR